MAQEMERFHLRVLRWGSKERPERRCKQACKDGEVCWRPWHSLQTERGCRLRGLQEEEWPGLREAEEVGRGGRQTGPAGPSSGQGQGFGVHAERAGKPSAGEWNLLTHGLALKGSHQLPWQTGSMHAALCCLLATALKQRAQRV